MDTKTAWNSFSELATAQELYDYMQDRPFGHKYFYHYTKVSIINLILKNREIWLSCVSGFNDKADGEQFGEEETQKYYSISFSTGDSENLALWYLYSGVGGNGGRIGFTCKKLLKSLDHGEFYIFEKTKTGTKKRPLHKLTRGVDMKLTLGEVLYASEGRKYAGLRYNTMTNYGRITNDTLKEYSKMAKGFCKDSIWYYEKESRLLLELSDEIFKKLNHKKEYVVVWKLPETVVRSLRVMFAPEIEEEADLDEYDAIIGHGKKNKPLEYSQFKGAIKMKLCSGCKHKEKLRQKNKKIKTTCENCKNTRVVKEANKL